MHDNEIPIDETLVRRLLDAQFGMWADLPLVPINPPGTVNAMFRLGQDKCVRLPRLPRWDEGLQQELAWLPVFARHLSLAIPEPLAEGRPSAAFPFTWAIYRWIPGGPADRHSLHDERQAARRLARFVTELRRVNDHGAPRSTRDRPLSVRDAETRAAIASLPRDMDREAIRAAWEVALQAPAWSGKPVWTHGDLLPPNLVLRQGQVAGVIDFGNMGAGDPAVDLIPAWTLFGEVGRQHFRAATGAAGGDWARSRGFALHQALLIIPYYLHSNPAFAAMARRTVAQVLADQES